MKKTNLCFCLRGTEIFLPMKKRGFGAGLNNGPGGKLQPEDLTMEAAMIRELGEETGLQADAAALEPVCVVGYSFEGVPVFECQVYFLREWRGEPEETEEMAPAWFPLDGIPYEKMWLADARMLPELLAGKRGGRLEVNYSKDGKEILSYEWR